LDEFSLFEGRRLFTKDVVSALEGIRRRILKKIGFFLEM
jgi:hypothetical protein